MARVEAPADVPAHERRQGVAHDEHRDDRASSLVRGAEDGDEDHEEHQRRHLHARAQQRGERGQVPRRAEHVPVHEFPAALLRVPAAVLHVVRAVLRVLGVVVAQRAHQDHRHQAGEEDDHHERVEDGEPVDLVLEEVVVQVPLEPLAKRGLGRGPRHAVRELQRRAHHQRLGVLRHQVHRDHAVAVETDVKALVRVNQSLRGIACLANRAQTRIVKRVPERARGFPVSPAARRRRARRRGVRGGRVFARIRLRVFGGALHIFAHEAPDGQVVHHELVPVVFAHGALEDPRALMRQHVHAQRGLGLVDAELELDVGIDELVALQDLPEATPLVRRLRARRGRRAAERELVVVVRLLGVVVRAHLVLPEDHAVAHGVLVIVLIRARGDRAREQKHEQRAGDRGGSREPGAPRRGLARGHRARSTDASPEATPGVGDVRTVSL